MWEDNRDLFSTEGRVIMDYGLIFWSEVMVENAMIDFFLANMQLFALQDSN